MRWISVAAFVAGCAVGVVAGRVSKVSPPPIVAVPPPVAETPRASGRDARLASDPDGGRAARPETSTTSLAAVDAGEAGAQVPEKWDQLLALLEGRPPFDVWSPEARFEAASKLSDDPGANGWRVLMNLFDRPSTERADVGTRVLAVRVLVQRREVSGYRTTLQSVAAADPDPEVWRPALAGWLDVDGADPEVLSRSLLAAAESSDPETRSSVLDMLHRAGPPGVALALRLLADAGRDELEEADLIASLVRADRWDALLATPMSDRRASALVAELWEVVEEPGPRADLVRRAAEIPRPEDPTSWCRLLCQHLQRADVALAVARDAGRSVTTRCAILGEALLHESCAPVAVPAACGILEDPATPTELRRSVVDFLDNADDDIVSAVALDPLRRVAAADPSAAIREAAAALVRNLTESE